MLNDYYDIAINNLKYLEVTLGTEFYNDISIGAQQVAEKLLKSVLEQLFPTTDSYVNTLLHSHNLRAIYTKICEVDSTLNLDRRDLSMLKDYYFDAKYPGDYFVTVSRSECEENLEIMYNVIEEVNKFRENNNLSVTKVKRKQLKSMDCF